MTKMVISSIFYFSQSLSLGDVPTLYLEAKITRGILHIKIVNKHILWKVSSLYCVGHKGAKEVGEAWPMLKRVLKVSLLS